MHAIITTIESLIEQKKKIIDGHNNEIHSRVRDIEHEKQIIAELTYELNMLRNKFYNGDCVKSAVPLDVPNMNACNTEKRY